MKLVNHRHNGHTLITAQPRQYRKKKSADLAFVDKVITAFSIYRVWGKRRIFVPRNALAIALGLLTSGLCPIGVYLFTHIAAPVSAVLMGEIAYQPIFALWWTIAVGGLVFSFPSVFSAFLEAFGCKFKAAGATVLIEASMIFAPTSLWIYSVVCLGILLFINWITATVKLSRG